LARIRRGVDRHLPRSLRSAVSCRRPVGLLRDLRRRQRVAGSAPRIRLGPHRRQPDEQSTGKPAAGLPELRLTATDVQESEPWQRAPLPPTAIRQRSVVLTGGSDRSRSRSTCRRARQLLAVSRRRRRSPRRTASACIDASQYDYVRWHDRPVPPARRVERRSATVGDAAFIVEMARHACVIEDWPLPDADSEDTQSLLPRGGDVAVVAADTDGVRLGAAWTFHHEPPLLLDPTPLRCRKSPSPSRPSGAEAVSVARSWMSCSCAAQIGTRRSA
jgi:hypothetical protein